MVPFIARWGLGPAWPGSSGRAACIALNIPACLCRMKAMCPTDAPRAPTQVSLPGPFYVFSCCPTFRAHPWSPRLPPVLISPRGVTLVARRIPKCFLATCWPSLPLLLYYLFLAQWSSSTRPSLRCAAVLCAFELRVAADLCLSTLPRLLVVVPPAAADPPLSFPSHSVFFPCSFFFHLAFVLFSRPYFFIPAPCSLVRAVLSTPSGSLALWCWRAPRVSVHTRACLR